jgi:hypothetical protein
VRYPTRSWSASHSASLARSALKAGAA